MVNASMRWMTWRLYAVMAIAAGLLASPMLLSPAAAGGCDTPNESPQVFLHQDPPDGDCYRLVGETYHDDASCHEGYEVSASVPTPGGGQFFCTREETDEPMDIIVPVTPSPSPPPEEDDDGDPIDCTTLPGGSTFSAHGWYSGSGGAPGTWWGRIFYNWDGCGNVTSTPQVTCTLQQCVDETVAPLIGAMATMTEAPSLQMNPGTPEGMVQLHTWFWDDNPWTVASVSNSHGQADVDATALLSPTGMVIDAGDGGATSCPHQGEPWVAGSSPDNASSDCSHLYTRPSGPGGYTISAYRLFGTTCLVNTNGGGNAYTLPGGCSDTLAGPTDTVQYRVLEAQSLNTR